MPLLYRANYALGRPVKGTATIAVYPRYKAGHVNQPINTEYSFQIILLHESLSRGIEGSRRRKDKGRRCCLALL